jgi:hypothetical protein
LPLKKCESCGKEIEKTSKKRFCSLKCANEMQKKNNTITRHCIWCDKDFNVLKSSRKIKLCSKECEKEYVKSKIRNDKRLETLKKNNLKEYGVEWLFQTDEYKNKFKKTCYDKYGVDNPMKINSVKEKSILTNMNKYGVKNPMQNKEIKNKANNTMKEKYGVEYPLQSEQIKNKMKQTNLEKYNDENYNNREKFEITMEKKYGDDWRNKMALYNGYQKILKRLPNNIIPLFTKIEYISSLKYIKYDFKCKICDSSFKGYLTNGHTPSCPICNPNVLSQPEEDLYIFLTSIIDNKEIYRNNRQQISPLELDIYIPSKNLAIEFNGIKWHSEVFGQKDKNYHLNKTKMCEQNGIKLIHIFENEWINKQEIIKSIIKSNLNLYDKIIYARKCEIREINSKEKDLFLINNHLQGKDISSKRYGLYYENELVSVMTFSKSRFNKKVEWEMTRFANKLNAKIIGGASKLFGHFLKEINPNSVISYSDKRYFNGSLYQKLGFSFLGDTNPNYFYFNDNDDYLKLFNRISFQKHKLTKLLENYNNKLTEWENMQLNGYDRIFDCGNKKFIWNIK